MMALRKGREFSSFLAIALILTGCQKSCVESPDIANGASDEMLLEEGWCTSVVLSVESIDGKRGSWHLLISPNGDASVTTKNGTKKVTVDSSALTKATNLVNRAHGLPLTSTIGRPIPDQETAVLMIVNGRRTTVLRIEGLDNVDFRSAAYTSQLRLLNLWCLLEPYGAVDDSQSLMAHYIRSCIEDVELKAGFKPTE